MEQESRTGAWIEMGGIWFVGAGLLAPATPNKIGNGWPTPSSDASCRPRNILWAVGGFSKEDLQLLREKFAIWPWGIFTNPLFIVAGHATPGP